MDTEYFKTEFQMDKMWEIHVQMIQEIQYGKALDTKILEEVVQETHLVWALIPMVL